MGKVIVIGAGGQVANDLVPTLDERGDELVLVDRVAAGEANTRATFEHRLADRDWQSRWRQVDVTDAPAVRELIESERPDVVYHLAATLSARCEDDTEACWRINLTGFRNVLDALCPLGREGSCPKLLWPSSIAAFGPPYDGDESYVGGDEHPLLPRTLYGVTKVTCELLGSYRAEAGQVDFRSVRFPGLINTAEPGGGSSDYANVMYFAAARGERAATSFVGPEARIPFMYMGDAVRALLQLEAADESRLRRRVYNVRAFPAPSAAEIAASIAREVPGFTVRYEPDARQRTVNSWPDDVDDRSARRDWSWQPEIDRLDAMTRRLLADIRALDRAV